jgi:hypothetical protein
MPAEKSAKFEQQTLIGCAGQSAELAGAYVLPACDVGSYMTGAVVPGTGVRNHDLSLPLNGTLRRAALDFYILELCPATRTFCEREWAGFNACQLSTSQLKRS